MDIGCGTGNLTERLLRKGLQVVGVDQSLEMLVQAKKKLPSVLLHQGTFLALPFEKQEFDTITASYAFHHCDEEERLLAVREMKRVLRSGGRIIIADLMFADKKARSRYEEQCTARQRAELEDECFTTVEALTQLFTAEGFMCSNYQISDSIWIFLAELA